MKKMFLFSVLTTFSILNVNASWYPPDYGVSTYCQENDITKVCVINKILKKPYLQITYKGYLRDLNPGNVNVFVKIDNRQAYFQMAHKKYDEFVSINHYRNVHLCNYNSASTSTPQYPHCPNATDMGNQSSRVDWYRAMPPQVEQNLVTPISEYQPVTVQVAFFDNEGNWDSNYGQNFSFVLK